MSSKTTMAEPQLLPSPPPSPSPSHTPIEQDTNDAHLTPAPSATNKGKGRMVDDLMDPRQNDQEDEDSDEYPPDGTETKRIEETLRRWEVEERERRRLARESASSSKYSMRGVTRSASAIWTGLRNQRPRSMGGGGGGHHHVLPDNENEDGVPLEDLDRTPPPSGANTPTIKQEHDTFSPYSNPTAIDNPFRDPDGVQNASTISLNTPDHSTILTESSLPPSVFLSPPPVDRKRKKEPPPPQPLGLPKPRPPPPRNDQDQAYITEPPDQTVAPSITTRGAEHPNPVEPEKETKWWTEWLCGCSEGPDRGGYNQSGRTNPNE